jgi:hypothetical protein
MGGIGFGVSLLIQSLKKFNGFVLMDYCRLTLKNLTYDLEKACIYGTLCDSWHL